MLDREIILSLDVGTGKLESELDIMSKQFVPTAFYDQLLRDEYDLVLGAKGMGKSALYWGLTTEQPGQLPFPPNVHITAPFGEMNELSTAVREVFAEPHPQFEFEEFWVRYLTLVAASECVGENICELPDGIRQAVDAMADPYGKTLSLWKRARDFTWIHHFDLSPVDRVMRQGAESRSMLSTLDQALVQSGRRLWVVLDKLDEVFSSDLGAEAKSLHGLVLALKRLNARPNGANLRFKAFLRGDLWHRIRPLGGVPNISELRTATLTWDAATLAAVVARRLASVRPLFEERGAPPDLGPSQFIEEVLPTFDGLPRNHMGMNFAKTTLNWLKASCRDASMMYNPRFIMWTLTGAKIEALRDISDGTEWKEHANDQQRYRLFTCGQLRQGWKRASEQALRDVTGEHDMVNQAVRELDFKRGLMPLPTWRDSVRGRMGVSSGDPVIEALEAVGITGTRAGKMFVGPIFQPALGINAFRADGEMSLAPPQ